MKIIVLVAMMPEADIVARELKDLVTEVRVTGMGKVNAAIAAVNTARELHNGDVALNLGTAAALDPKLGLKDVVMATHFIQHDYIRVDSYGEQIYRPGRLPVGPLTVEPEFEWEYLNSTADFMWKSMWPRDYTFHIGGEATGDTFVATLDKRAKIFERTRAKVVDMEAAAMAQVLAPAAEVLFYSIKGVSDRATLHTDTDFAQNLEGAMLNVTDTAKRLIHHL